MASRLLGRYARMLCRSSSRASAAAVRLPVAVPAEVQRANGWPWATERLMTETTSAPKEDNIPIMFRKSELDALIEKATVPEDVLSAWEKHQGNGHKAANALTKWARLMLMTNGKFKDQPPEVMMDPRLQDMMRTLTSQVSKVWNSALVSVLQTLWTMGVPSNSSALGSVQTEVLWRIRRLTYKQLGSLADWGAYRKGEQDVALFNSVLKQLELRWTEISDTKTVRVLISRGECMSSMLMDRLEDKALELAENFSADDIAKICLALAHQNRRSIPLLGALSYHLLQMPSSVFTTQLILDMAFAHGKLNFQHAQIFQRMASELLPRVPELSSVDVTRCAKSLGFLKWLDIPLFESFAEHYTTNDLQYSTLQVCNLLMTFAKLDFHPSKGDGFYSKVHLVLEDSLTDLGPFLQTDVVWSLCVLQQAKPHYLIPLTEHSHVTKLLVGSPSRVDNYRLKLLHIATTLHLEHAGSSDTLSSPSILLEPVTITHQSMLQRNLRAAFENLMAGNTKVLRTGVDTVYGWTIDAELVVDGDNKPIDLSMLKASHLPSGGGDEVIPVGARQLAFLAMEFANFGSKNKVLLGRFAMMKRHLQLAGFITVEVPYYEWQDLKTEWQKVAYLKDKVGKAVAMDMAK